MAILFSFSIPMRKHKFLTKEILNDFRKIGDQSESDDPIIVCKYFDPFGKRTWFISEYDEKSKVCFGFVVGIEGERGYFALCELENYKGPYGIGIERDAHFKKCRFSELKEKEGL